MTLNIYQVDAFSSELFSGNPAAVVILNKWLDEQTMQKIAMENNLAETAFITPCGPDLEIRWFTPTTEVELCGHATLAAAHVLFNHEDLEGEEVTFQSNSGTLRVSKSDSYLTLDFPMDEYKPVAELPELMQVDSKHWVKGVFKGKTDLMFILSNERQVADFVPNLEIIKKLDCRGVIITAPGEKVDFVSRFFAPQSGIPEDPVTGSAHTTLTPYWAKQFKKNSLTAAQLSPRGGLLNCEIKGQRVYIGGQCKTYMKGNLYI